MAGIIKTPEEIAKIRSAGKILARVMTQLVVAAEEGIATKDLDDLAYGLIKKAGAEPAFLNYKPSGANKPYPATICASLNETVVHGVPGNRRLISGDILKIDLGVKYQSYIADAALTLAIGKIGEKAEKLIKTAKLALEQAIKIVKPGKTLGDIGHAIQTITEKNGFKVVKGLTGHGVGRELHEEPSIFNEGKPGKGLKLEAGMVLAIEPMISMGSSETVKQKDDSYATRDGSLSAHFEKTVVITENGAEILTVI